MRFRGLFFTLIIALLFMLPASAQIPANKLFAYSNGDLWTWFMGGNPEQITTWAYNSGPLLAPDERFIAYLSISTEGVEEINAGQAYPFMGTPPTNIWIMDTATLLAEKIVDQENYPTLRGIPAWSPSGREIAWIEYVQNTQVTRLLVYDMDTRRSTILNENVNAGFQDGGFYLPAVQWGQQGISRLLGTYSETGQLLFIMEVFNAETGALSQYLLATGGDLSSPATSDFPIDYVWVTHQGQSMMAILTRAGEWYLLDPRDGAQYTLSRGPGLVNNNAATSISPVFTEVGDSWEIHWRANDGTIALNLPFVNYSISQGTPSLAPDGSAVAWNNNGDLSYIALTEQNPHLILDSPETSTFVQPGNIAWSAMHWVTKAETTARATPVISNGNACNLASRLQIGDFVTVSAGEPNNVRRDANLSSPIIARFASGALAQVTDGPVCVDGFRWWYVSNEVLVGWTAENSSSEYWLLPLAQSPFLNTCPLAPRLGAGNLARVLPGIPNLLRDGPDANGTAVIGAIPGGEIIRVLGDSLCGTDGRRWYPVDYDGLLGWTAEGEGSSYWLEPS
jgi:hypothetical protein